MPRKLAIPAPDQHKATARLKADFDKCPKCGHKFIRREFQSEDGEKIFTAANCQYLRCLFSWVERYTFDTAWPKE
jgi:predicted RNA-binding Zn-ribbon protein involved in translation (DUF1610 family)